MSASTQSKSQSKPQAFPADLAQSRFRDPAPLLLDDQHLQLAAARLRRTSREQYDRDAELCEGHSALMWVDVDLSRPTKTVNPYALQTGGGLALLVVGWSGERNRHYRGVPEMLSVLIPLDPEAPTVRQVHVRDVTCPPFLRASSAAGRPMPRQFYLSDVGSERGWAYWALALAEQLTAVVAGEFPPERVPWTLEPPHRGYFVPEPPDPATGVSPGQTLYQEHNCPEGVTRSGCWLASEAAGAVEYDRTTRFVHRIPQVGAWAVQPVSVRGFRWDVRGVDVRYQI